MLMTPSEQRNERRLEERKDEGSSVAARDKSQDHQYERSEDMTRLQHMTGFSQKFFFNRTQTQQMSSPKTQHENN